MVCQEALLQTEIQDSLVTFGGHSGRKWDYCIVHSAYHPETNGQTEVVNRSPGNLLRNLSGENLGQWDMVLAQVEFAYSDSVNRSIGKSPL